MIRGQELSSGSSRSANDYHKMKTIASLLLAWFTAYSALGQLLIPYTVVQGTDVFSGPTFTVLSDLSADATVSVQVTGQVDVDLPPSSGGPPYAQNYNAAGIAVPPNFRPIGQTHIRDGKPVGAVVIGNGVLGFHELFPAEVSSGLGSLTPPTDIQMLNRRLDEVFPGFAGLSAGAVLELRVWDVNDDDNAGQFVLFSIPEPPALACSAITSLAALLILGRRAARQR